MDYSVYSWIRSTTKTMPETIKLKINDDVRTSSISFWESYDPGIEFSFFTFKEGERIDNIFYLPAILEHLKRSKFKLMEKKDHHLSKILCIISLTLRGRQFLKDFIPLLTEGPVRIEMSYAEEGIASQDYLSSSQYKQSYIYLPGENTLLGYLYNLVHEGTHALDLAGTRDDDLIYNFMRFCKKHSESVKSLMRSMDSEDINIEAACEALEDFYSYFPALLYEGDRNRNARARVDKFIDDIIFIQQNANMRLIESEHKAYRAQEVFLNQLDELGNGRWVAGNFIRSSHGDEIRAIGREDFIEGMKKIYSIHDAYFEKYFALHDWKEFN